MEPVPVFDGARLRATLHPGTSRRLMTTFDFRREARGGFEGQAHSTAYARQGFSQLVLQTAANDWFVNDETAALEAALRPLAARFERVQALGYSMGGFGALRLARALGAAQVVAVSPQSGLRPWDPRYAAEGAGWDAALGDLAPGATARLTGLLVVDPFDALDLRHARAVLGHFPGLRLVRLAFGGHPAIRALRAAGTDWVVRHEAARVRPDGRAVLAAHRAGRRRSPGYWARLAQRAEARRPALAARARAEAARLGPRAGDWDGPILDAPARIP